MTPNWEIGFGFVSCSCRARERAGEAKLCGRVREQSFPTLVPRMVRCAPAAAFPAVLWYLRFCCYAHELFDFCSFLDAMLMGFLICFRFCCYAHGFLMCLYTCFVFAAMLMGFLIFLCFCCYAHTFFDVVAQ